MLVPKITKTLFFSQRRKTWINCKQNNCLGYSPSNWPFPMKNINPVIIFHAKKARWIVSRYNFQVIEWNLIETHHSVYFTRFIFLNSTQVLKNFIFSYVYYFVIIGVNKTINKRYFYSMNVFLFAVRLHFIFYLFSFRRKHPEYLSIQLLEKRKIICAFDSLLFYITCCLEFKSILNSRLNLYLTVTHKIYVL